jgi:hypothetical protein
MDKRKNYSVDDKVKLVRNILELAEKKGIGTRLEMSVYAYNDYEDYFDMVKINNTYKLHEEYIESADTRWTKLHNGKDKTDSISGDIDINIFKGE